MVRSHLDMDGEQIIADDAEAVEIEMTIDLAASTAERAGLKIHATEDGAYTYVAYDGQIGRVVVDRQAMANGDRGYRTAPLSDAELASGKLDLRVFVDRGSVEVYVNGGRQVLSSYTYASEGPRAIKLVAESGTSQGRVPEAPPHEVHRTGVTLHFRPYHSAVKSEGEVSISVRLSVRYPARYRLTADLLSGFAYVQHNLYTGSR